MRYDVAIVGAGTAGAAAAWQCARRGLSTVLLDARDASACGPQWVNAVSLAQFDAAGVPRPEAPELVGGVAEFHLVAGWDGPRVVVPADHHDLVEVDMRALVARLQGLATEAGAEACYGVRVLRREGRILHTDAGIIEATHLVDASGLARILAPTEPTPREHLCVAAQQLREVNDLAAARAWFEDHEVPPGAVLCFTGVEGGYSIVNVRLHGERVAILAGSLAAGDHRPGAAMIDAFVADHPWVGERIFGGGRAIPIHRPLDALSVGPVARIGDAGSQVFPIHGSGIGLGLMAARLLGETLETGGDAEQYALAFHRRHGGRLAAYDALRRFSSSLSPEEMGVMIRAGLVTARSAAAALSQRWPTGGVRHLRPGALRQVPGPLRGRMARTLGTVATSVAAYRMTPRRARARRLWSRGMRRLLAN